jgi:hypothetical protein
MCRETVIEKDEWELSVFFEREMNSDSKKASRLSLQTSNRPSALCNKNVISQKYLSLFESHLKKFRWAEFVPLHPKFRRSSQQKFIHKEAPRIH